MASRSRQIIEKIKELVAVDYTAGESRLDMRNKVQVGAIIDPPYPFWVCLLCRPQANTGNHRSVSHHKHL